MASEADLSLFCWSAVMWQRRVPGPVDIIAPFDDDHVHLIIVVSGGTLVRGVWMWWAGFSDRLLDLCFFGVCDCCPLSCGVCLNFASSVDYGNSFLHPIWTYHCRLRLLVGIFWRQRAASLLLGGRYKGVVIKGCVSNTSLSLDGSGFRLRQVEDPNVETGDRLLAGPGQEIRAIWSGFAA